jgi:hypothetical protein
MLRGGCYCGQVRYEAEGAPFHETSCHCSICRRTTGAPFVTWFSLSRAQFRITRGEPKRFRSTGRATRSFCPECGTQLTFEHDDYPDEIDVTTCSLDEPESVAPKHHIYTSSKLNWIKLADSLPQYPETR